MSSRFEVGRLVTNADGTVQGRIARYDKAPVAPYKKEWPIVDWDGWGLTLTDPDTIQAVKSRSILRQDSATATETNTHQGAASMNHTIKAPRTVQELGNLAAELDMLVSEVWDLLVDVNGPNWWKHDADDFEDFELTSGTAIHAATPPAGYLREKGRKGTRARKSRFTGTERLAKDWMLTPTWNAETNEHAIELWSALDTSLTPAKARKLAVALLELADAVEAASTTEGATK